MSSHTNNLVRLAAAILSRQQQLRSPLAGAAGAAVRASSAASLQGADSLPVVQHRRQLACAAADACWQQWRVSSTATSCRTLWTQPQNKGRCFSSGAGDSPGDASSTTTPSAAAGVGHNKDMAIVFTCAKCDTRAVKAFSKQSYERGLVLIRCPGCDSLHLIADHLGWFGDTGFKIDKYLSAQGQSVKRMSLDTQQQASAAADGGGGVEQQQQQQLTAQDLAGWSKVQQLLTTVASQAAAQEGDQAQSSSSSCGSSGASAAVGSSSCNAAPGSQAAGGSQEGAAAAAVLPEADSGVVQVTPEDVQGWLHVQQHQK